MNENQEGTAGELGATAAGAPSDALALAEPAQVATPAKPRTIVGLDAMRAALASSSKSGQKILARADIMAAQDIKYRIVPVPEWGGSVVIRTGSGTDRDAFEGDLVTVNGKVRTVNHANIRAKLAARAIVDPSDPNLARRQFTDEEITLLGTKSAAALTRVYENAAELWGLTDADVDELSGNSGKADSGDSSAT